MSPHSLGLLPTNRRQSNVRSGKACAITVNLYRCKKWNLKLQMKCMYKELQKPLLEKIMFILTKMEFNLWVFQMASDKVHYCWNSFNRQKCPLENCTVRKVDSDYSATILIQLRKHSFRFFKTSLCTCNEWCLFHFLSVDTDLYIIRSYIFAKLYAINCIITKWNMITDW